MNQRHERDEWLMAQVALGHREHLEPLLRRYAGPLLTFIQRMIGDRHRSEELFQDVFLSVWRHRAQYRFPKPFKSWLFAIAANACRAEYRKRRPLATQHLETEQMVAGSTPEPNPEMAAISVETAAQVVEAVNRLPTKQRTVVVMRVWSGLSYAEIAQSLGRSEATVRSHMHHALAALRQSLTPVLEA